MFVCVRGPTFPPQVGQQGHLGVGTPLDDLRHKNTQTGEEEEEKKGVAGLKCKSLNLLNLGLKLTSATRCCQSQ